MSYRCGIGPGLFDIAPREPHIACDGCGAQYVVRGKHGVPPGWFLDGKPPPKWAGRRGGLDGLREDWCPVCRAAGKHRQGAARLLAADAGRARKP